MKIYIITAKSGNDSGYYRWFIMAYKKKKRALEHAKNAEICTNELYRQYPYYSDIPEGINEYDPEMIAEESGVFYYVNEVELKE